MNQEYNKKPINRIAKPIMLDENGNAIIDTENKKEIKSVKKKKTSTRFTIMLITILLLTTIITIVLLPIVLIPRYTPTDLVEKIVEENDYVFTNLTLNDEMIRSDYSKNINEMFQLDINNKELYVNNIFVANVDSINNQIGLIDELIVISMSYQNNTSIIIINKDGKIVKQYKNLLNTSLSMSNEIIINPTSIVVNFINNDITNICENLSNNAISEDEIISGFYRISYKGKNSFTEPTFITGITRAEYNSNNC